MYYTVPLRDVAIFPGTIVPLFIGREISIKSINKAIEEKQSIVLVSQKDSNIEEPEQNELYEIATLADIIQSLTLPDGTIKLVVEGKSRILIKSLLSSETVQSEVEILNEKEESDKSDKNYKALLSIFNQYTKTQIPLSRELLETVNEVKDVSILCDIMASHSSLNLNKKNQLLAEVDIDKRVILLISFFESELSISNIDKSIRSRVKKQMDKNQKEYYLNEQAKAIQQELENLDESKTDFGKLKAKIKKASMPKPIEKKCFNELNRLKRMPILSSESTVLRSYLDVMIEYPWSISEEINNDINTAEEILNKSHLGLEVVKERILEYIAVHQRTNNSSANILCLVGPPGVGKTSIAKSIANSINRKYIRMALGGIRDEAEIRGHRKTYIGAMPGRVVQNLIKAKVNNPLFLLDEIDKMSKDHNGSPESAMLEVLDPEQNNAFNDHYIEESIDLSKVLFIATANSLNIPDALLDRMEIIRVPGYTESEKFNIAKKYLIPQSLKNNGLQAKNLNITNKALSIIIQSYTREAGVRGLTQEINKICRKYVRNIGNNETKSSINQKNLIDFLGPEKYIRENLNTENSIGRINGLAWTSVGGELLNIEVVILPGKGKVHLTGKLGDVMKESVQASMTVVKGYAYQYEILPKFFQEHDFHIHLPEAATPKDGPSAGIAMTTALLSAILQLPINNNIAMTGEISLQGNVLAIGGLKEKLFAATREKVEKVFIPYSNIKDLHEISDEIKDSLSIIPVKHITDVLSEVFPGQWENKNKNKLFDINKFIKNNTKINNSH